MAKSTGITMMLLITALASTAWGQQLMPKSEITAGYTYGSLDQNVGFGSAGRLNANGWNTGATTYINRWLGIEGNIAGLTHSESALVSDGVNTVSGSASEKHYTFVFGPRIALDRGRISPFVHGLFGFDRETLSASGSFAGVTASSSSSDTAFAWALGGGLQYAASKHFALVGGADYLMTRHGLPSDLAALLGTSGSASQNNFRLNAGVVFRFGYGSGRGPKR